MELFNYSGDIDTGIPEIILSVDHDYYSMSKYGMIINISRSYVEGSAAIIVESYSHEKDDYFSTSIIHKDNRMKVHVVQIINGEEHHIRIDTVDTVTFIPLAPNAIDFCNSWTSRTKFYKDDSSTVYKVNYYEPLSPIKEWFDYILLFKNDYLGIEVYHSISNKIIHEIATGNLYVFLYAKQAKDLKINLIVYDKSNLILFECNSYKEVFNLPKKERVRVHQENQIKALL